MSDKQKAAVPRPGKAGFGPKAAGERAEPVWSQGGVGAAAGTRVSCAGWAAGAGGWLQTPAPWHRPSHGVRVGRPGSLEVAAQAVADPLPDSKDQVQKGGDLRPGVLTPGPAVRWGEGAGCGEQFTGGKGLRTGQSQKRPGPWRFP